MSGVPGRGRALARSAPAGAPVPRVVAVTGGSILYSQARELVLAITGRGPWGSFQLPTVSFLDMEVAEDPRVGVSETAAKPRESRRSPARSKPRGK